MPRKIQTQPDKHSVCPHPDISSRARGTVAGESGLKSAGTLLSRVRSLPQAPSPDRGPESLRSPCCGLAICTKEASFVYAITTAGVTYAITQACSLGNLESCGCDQDKRDGQLTSAGWRWGGCSADIRYGLRMTRKFMDVREFAKTERSFMNLHNNRAGRKAVKDNLHKECKCHGVSGSCTLKTCWTTLPSFRRIGDALLRRYYRAKQVEPYLGGRLRRPISLYLKRSKRQHRKPRRSHLVYLEKSPNYCDYDPATHSLGTVGRSCNRTSIESDGCTLMCCGRGYNTHQYILTPVLVQGATVITPILHYIRQEGITVTPLLTQIAALIYRVTPVLVQGATVITPILHYIRREGITVTPLLAQIAALIYRVTPVLVQGATVITPILHYIRREGITVTLVLTQIAARGLSCHTSCLSWHAHVISDDTVEELELWRPNKELSVRYGRLFSLPHLTAFSC
ncbi:hypothetical protein PoB_007093400 [Plakobranchus ocellatus]|uniref:Protein Wnt n=1 Tax=Plakobranchus ocellatus TaxID=259542 RepID=A0AAV4DK80_9GAST|nr:hypothetical protein PoB_007093400 [Plakobranchus ocellatus]